MLLTTVAGLCTFSRQPWEQADEAICKRKTRRTRRWKKWLMEQITQPIQAIRGYRITPQQQQQQKSVNVALMYYFNHKHFLYFSLYKVACCCNILSGTLQHTWIYGAGRAFVLKRKADMLLVSSHHPLGHHHIREGHSELRLRGSEKEKDVLKAYSVYSVCVCVC